MTQGCHLCLQWSNPEELFGIGKCEWSFCRCLPVSVCSQSIRSGKWMICMALSFLAWATQRQHIQQARPLLCADGADAYFMFCRGEWQRVLPKDKDLLK